jgi:hypothetical protein
LGSPKNAKCCQPDLCRNDAGTVIDLYAGSFVILGITVEVVLGVPITIASWLGGMVVPFAIAVALFKYRPYDIDRIINRTLVYGLLTIMLGAVYLAGVFGIGLLLNPVTGESALAVAASTLAVAALFQPARRRVQPGHSLRRAARGGQPSDAAHRRVALASTSATATSRRNG